MVDRLHSLGEIGGFTEARPSVVLVAGRRLTVFLRDGEFYVIDDTCPHRGGPLGQGHVDGFEVYCPMHGWAFDFRTGACITHPNRRVRSYENSVRDGHLWVRLG